MKKFAGPWLLLTVTTSCNAFRGAVIQAPSLEEQRLSRDAYEAKGFENHESFNRNGFFLHKDFRSADSYCRNLVVFGQDAYRDSLWWGVPLTVVGLGGTAASTAWAATAEDKSEAAVGKITLATTSAVIAAIGLIFVGRSTAAATASGDAGLAFVPGMKEEEQWKVCHAARAKWLGGNAEAANIAKSADAKDEEKDDKEKDDKEKDDKEKDDKEKDDKEKDDKEKDDTQTGKG